SGTHLSVICALFSWLLNQLRLKRKTKTFILLGVLISYLALSGFSPSAIRATIMCGIGLFAFIFKRRSFSINALAIAVIAFFAIDPSYAFSISLQLSVLAVLGIFLFTSLYKDWLKYILKGRFSKLAEPIAMTLAANITTLPLSISLFNQLSLISPLATLVASPFITIALGIGIIASLLALPCSLIANFILNLDSVIVSICNILVSIFAKVKLACIPINANSNVINVIFLFAIILIWLIWPTPDKLKFGRMKNMCIVSCSLSFPVILCLVLGLGSPIGALKTFVPIIPNFPQIVMLDVGQGDSMLIRDGTSAILIDTGEDSTKLKQGLANHAISSLDAIIITHKDSDHAGALKSLSGIVSVSNVFVHSDLLNEDFEKNVLNAAKQITNGKGASGLKVGDKLKIGRFNLTMIAPKEGGESENADSIINLIEFDENNDGKAESKILCSGDAEQEQIEPLKEIIGDIDVLKVGHHGSKVSTNDEILNVIKPEIGLISVGRDNKYGHPKKETLEFLQNHNVKILRTDLNGEIKIEFSLKNINVNREKIENEYM
ncbi:MAG: DNA internalization-related competence protein ComEC/Rec2, partial [Coriobacteriales bacterium]|nr:DNA internalization-related competence protein ComEC/Rec2 [Coriobacteriales bacterium]